MDGARSISLQSAIDELGFGAFQRRLLLVCGVTWAADAAEIFLVSFALPGIRKEFGLSTFGSAWLVTAGFLGMLVGAWFWGTISDRIGRKRGFTMTIGIFALFGLLSAFSPNAAILGVLRFLTGFGLGGAVPLDFSLFAEYLPTRNRGRWLVLLEAFWGVGTVVAAGLAWILVPTVGWRWLLATSAVAGALVFWVRLRVPESPRYLATAGRMDEARQVLATVAEANGRSLDVARVEAPRPEPTPGVKALWAPGLRRVTLMLWLAWFFIALGYYGLFSWLPQIFADRGFTAVRTYGYSFALAVASIPGYLSAAWLVEQWGRRRVLWLYALASGVFTYVYAIVDSPGSILATGCLMSFFTLGAWAALYAYTPELAPTSIRTTSMGWASGMARIAGAIAPLLGGVLIPVSLVAALTVYAVAFVCAGLSVFLLGPETREQELADTLGAGALPAANR
jgi:putative MFS transporter